MATRRRPADLADHTWERVAAREVSRLVVIAPPWLGWALSLPLGIVLHRAWPGMAGALTLGGSALALALLDLHLTRQRKGLGRYLAALTTVAAGGWLGAVMASGISVHSPLARAWLIGGGTVAMIWTRWLHVHEAGDEAGMAKPFGLAALAAGFPGVRLIRSRVVDGATKGVIDHPGVEHDTMAKQTAVIEAHWPNKKGGLPPGSLVISRDPDAQGRSRVTIADPRLLNTSLPWPGPSRPGGSISEPVVIGRWQDGSPDSTVITGYHEQVMGMTGVGKTLGYAYSKLGEIISRRDAFVVTADLAKGSQFLGPMLPALHYNARTPAQFRALLEAVEASCIPRMEYLGDQNLGEWRPGCGLMYGFLWIEEAADAFEALGSDIEDYLFPMLRKVRSAGWSLIYSLHRASYDQMPTFLRDMVAQTTMGCNSWEAAKFGLSPAQAESDQCHPELWADDPEHYGKYYRSAKSLDKAHRLMAGRTWDWGRTTKLMAGHAAAFPASDRPFDAVTAPMMAKLLAPPAPAPAPARAMATAGARSPEPEEDGPMPLFPVDDDEDDLDLEALEGADLPLGADTGDDGPAVPVSPELALMRVRAQVQEWRRAGGVPSRRGGATDLVTVPDFDPLISEVGRQRTWIYAVMAKLEAEREVRKNPDGKGWHLLDKAS